MTKRLLCLMLVLVMFFSLCLTACSSGEEKNGETSEAAVDEEAQRPNLALTIYAITDAKTTPEGLAAVEEKISNYCVAKYKTSIDLRFYTESEYQSALNAMYDKFAVQEAEAKKQAEEAAAAAKSEAAYLATLSKEERQKYDQQKRMEKKAAEEEAKKKAEEEAELIAQGKDVATVKEVQMDLLYVKNMEDYYSYVDQELLLDLTSFLDNNFKNIKDYVYPSFLTAATVNGGIYGIPNNQAISTNETYFVVNTALAKKYGVDWEKVHSITDLNDVFARVHAGEPGTATITGDFGPEGMDIYDEIDMGRMVSTFFDTLPGGRFDVTNTFSTFNLSAERTAFLDYCATKALYRQSGYLSNASENFFLSVQSLTEEERMAWEKKGYTTVLYRGAKFTTKAALDSGLFGISKYCEEPERAMEVLQLISNDATMRNLLAFGVEEVNYIRSAENKNVITIIDDSYTMDFFHSGNTLLGYVPDTMDPNYVEKAKAKNLNSQISAYLGFRYDWKSEANKKWLPLFQQWKEILDPVYEQVSYGVPNYEALINQAYRRIYDNPDGSLVGTYTQWRTGCNFQSSYQSHLKALTSLDALLHYADGSSYAVIPTGTEK